MVESTNMKRQKGFTLIEMLVVISLVGILTVLSLVSFRSAQKQTNDTVRKSDLKQYQNALEGYGNLTNGLFPSRTAVSSAYSTLCGDLNIKFEPDISCSQDPKTEVDATYYDYKYISDGTNGTASATKYVLWALLENKPTTTYWVLCSIGKSGEKVSPAPSTSSCPI